LIDYCPHCKQYRPFHQQTYRANNNIVHEKVCNICGTTLSKEIVDKSEYVAIKLKGKIKKRRTK
jgi:hypothetical protein